MQSLRASATVADIRPRKDRTFVTLYHISGSGKAEMFRLREKTTAVKGVGRKQGVPFPVLCNVMPGNDSSTLSRSCTPTCRFLCSPISTGLRATVLEDAGSGCASSIEFLLSQTLYGLLSTPDVGWVWVRTHKRTFRRGKVYTVEGYWRAPRRQRTLDP
jgi:hypothetical protein